MSDKPPSASPSRLRMRWRIAVPASSTPPGARGRHRMGGATSRRSFWTRPASRARGAVVSTQDPLGAWPSFQYDAAGGPSLRVDALGWATTYMDDALGRTTGI